MYSGNLTSFQARGIGIGNIEQDHINHYLKQNKKLNGLYRHDKKVIQKKRKKKYNFPFTANVSNTKFEIVKRTFERMGFDLQENDNFKNSFLIWADGFVSQEKLAELKSYQRINHFLGMGEITRKDFFARKFLRIQKVRPDYDYFPKTWLFPQERNVFQKYLKETREPRKKKYFILKPANGAMGVGIKLLSEDDPIRVQDNFIVQEYIDKPFLLDGFKNDLRIYVLVTSCDPLRAYIYREGLVRLGTEKYTPPTVDLKLESHFIHLTNYSVNKKNQNYNKCQDETSGSKRSLSYLFNFLKSNNLVDTELLWRAIVDIVVKTLLLAQPHLVHNYRMCRPGQLMGLDSVCFEILGFDILLDYNYKPWLLEVNRSPSFGSDETLDKKVKGTLLEDTIRLLNIKPSDKLKYISFQKQRGNKRLTLAAIKSRIETQLNHEHLRKRKDIDKKKQELIDQLLKSRVLSAIEYYESRNIGNFIRIFPSDDKSLQDKYLSIINDSFTLFQQSNNQSVSGPVNNQSSEISQIQLHVVQSCQVRSPEEEIIDLIKDCEKEENYILAKFHLPTTAEQTSMIPNINFYESSSSDSEYSSSSEQSSSSELREDRSRCNYQPNKSATFDNNHNNPSGLVRSTTPSLKSKRNDLPQRSVSVASPPEDVPELRIQKRLKQKEEKERNAIPPKYNNAETIITEENINKPDLEKERMMKIDNDCMEKNEVEKFIQSRSNLIVGQELYSDLLKIILINLNNLTIRYPNQEDSLTRVLLMKIQNNWEFYRRPVANYWLVNLNSKKRQKIIDIVRNNVDNIINESEVCVSKLGRLLNKVYSRLLWNRGHGLMTCFTNKKSWKVIFSTRSENQPRPLEMDICSRVVQLCMDCVLIVHHYSLKLAESARDSGIPENIKVDSSIVSKKHESVEVTELNGATFNNILRTTGRRSTISDASRSSIAIIPQI